MISASSDRNNNYKKRGGGNNRFDNMGLVEKTSRQLSKLLRHQADKTKGITLRSDGYVPVQQILKLPQYKDVTFEIIEKTVKENDKQRFQLIQDENGEWLIKAKQGHSMKTVQDLELQAITSIEDLGEYKDSVIHGTYFDSYSKIITSGGLSRMKRLHIHFAIGEPEQGHVISGMRKSAQVIFFLNVELALKDGIALFKSENNVVLSPGDEKGLIPLKYFTKVLDRQTRRVLYDPINQPIPIQLEEDNKVKKK
ncbi:hypothetical protein ABK040_005763 [Willaertia magna]